MFKINLKTQEVIREELPQFLIGLDKASLVDLSWIDEALGLKGYGYFEEVDNSQDISETTTYDGTEALHVNMDLKIVEVIKGIRAKTEEELIADRKAKVPRNITMRQARLQLLNLGLLDDVEAVIASIQDANMKKAVQIEWEYAKDVERNSPTILLLAQAIGMDDEALDNLFIEAVKL